MPNAHTHTHRRLHCVVASSVNLQNDSLLLLSLWLAPSRCDRKKKQNHMHAHGKLYTRKQTRTHTGQCSLHAPILTLMNDTKLSNWNMIFPFDSYICLTWNPMQRTHTHTHSQTRAGRQTCIQIHPHIAWQTRRNTHTAHAYQSRCSRMSQHNEKWHISNENIQLISRLRFPLPRAGFSYSFYRFFHRLHERLLILNG